MLQDFWSRLQAMLIALVFIFLSTALLVAPSEVADFAGKLADQSQSTRQIMVALAVVVDLIFLAIVFRALRGNPETISGLLVQSRAANATVSVESVQTTLNQQIAKLAGIRSVYTRVTPRNGRVGLDIEVYTDDNLHTPSTIQAIEREVSKVVEKQMGLKRDKKPTIKFHPLGETVQPTPSEVYDMPDESTMVYEAEPEEEEKTTIPTEDMKTEPHEV